MQTINERAIGMVCLTFLTRLAAELERQGALPAGWSAAELRQAADQAEAEIPNAANASLQEDLASALRAVAAHLPKA